MRRRLPKVNRFSKHQPGIIMIMSFAFLLVVMILSVAFLSKTQNFLRFESRSIEQEMAIHIAEAGIDYAAYQLKINGNWQGVSSFALGEGEFEVSVGPKVINNKTVQVAAYVPSKASPRAKRFISMDFVPGELTFNSWQYALATLSGNLNVDTANITSENGTDPADIWSSNSITGLSPTNTVAGACNYDSAGGGTKSIYVSCNSTNGSAGNYFDQIDDIWPTSAALNNGCDNFYVYWEIAASGNPNLDTSIPPNCPAPITIPSYTIDCNTYDDGVTGDNTCRLSDPNKINGDVLHWNCNSQTWPPPAGGYVCELPNVRFNGNLRLQAPFYKWHIRGTVHVTGDFTMDEGVVIELDTPLDEYGLVILVNGKINLIDSILSGGGWDCIVRQQGSSLNTYLWLIAKSADPNYAISLGCEMKGVLSAPNGGLYFSPPGIGGVYPKLHGAAIAQKIHGNFAEMVFDYGLAGNSPFGTGPSSDTAFSPKKGTFSLIKETSFTSSLVGWWKFDGNANDSSGQNNNGSANGTTYINPGKFGQAIKFRGDPNDDYVEVPDSNSLDFQSTMSITAWFKKESPFDATAFLVQKGQYSSSNSSYEFGFPFSGAGNERIRFRLRSGPFWISSPASAAVSDNNWHFAGGTFDGTNLCVWLDTNKQCATYSGVTINLTSRPLTIGAASTSTAGDPIGVLNGQIDNVKIYKTGLTDAEVARDRDNGP